MSKLQKEIGVCMSKLRDDGESLSAHFCFPGDFSGFKGHFPGRPVLPGVCKLQAILCILETHFKKSPKLKEIISAKFFLPVGPGQELVFSLHRFAQESEDVVVKALVTHADKKIADIHLRVSF